MATEIIMPKNGMDMKEGVIVRWLKNVGDKVEYEEPIMEIETDKVTMESESPAKGTLLAKYFKDGDTVPVLTVIGYIGAEGEKVPEGNAPAAAPVPAAPAAASAASVAAPAASVKINGGVVAATPYARKLATDKGIDLKSIAPTGNHGEVVGRDVENVKAAPAAAVAAVPEGVKATPLAARVAAAQGVDLASVKGTGFNGKVTRDDVLACPRAREMAAVAEIEDVLARHKMNGMRKVIAARMLASHTEIPPVTQNVEVDVTALMKLREQYNDGLEKPDKLSINDFVMRAVAIVTREQSRYRMRLVDGEFEEHSVVNVGMAVGMDEGLIVPVIRNADMKSIDVIAKECKALAKKARDNKLTPDDYGNGTITVSNIGMFGMHSFTPIINQPEAAIVGVCCNTDRLVMENGNVAVHQIMMICLTYDHRIINGTEACAFEQRLKYLLEHPVKLML